MERLWHSVASRVRLKNLGKMRLLLLAGTAATLACSLQADVISQFNSSADGWLSNGVCSFSAASGNPAGDLDCGVQTNGPTLSAPAQFLGNDLAAYGKTFSFDVFNHLSNVALELDLEGAGLNLLYAFNTANNPPNLPPSDAWKTESVVLDGGPGWEIGNTGTLPNAQQFQSVLASLTSLQIVTSIPTFTDLAFDNIRLQGVTAVAEPQGTTLIGAGFLLLALVPALRRNQCR